MSPYAHTPPASYVQRYESSATNQVSSSHSCFAWPQLAQVAEVSAAPWLPDTLKELRTLKAAGVNLPGIGDFTLTDDTVDRARQLLTLTCITRLPAPTIAPFSGGGLALSWACDNRGLVLSVYPDREVTYERTDAEHSVVDDDTLASDPELTKIVDRFIASLA
jgi:hypothetical protein